MPGRRTNRDVRRNCKTKRRLLRAIVLYFFHLKDPVQKPEFPGGSYSQILIVEEILDVALAHSGFPLPVSRETSMRNLH